MLNQLFSHHELPALELMMIVMVLWPLVELYVKVIIVVCSSFEFEYLFSTNGISYF